jgi:hypothetical protein
MSRSSAWPLPISFSNQNIVYISCLSYACYVPLPSHLPDVITLIIFGEVYKLRSSSLWSLLQPPVTSSLLGLKILLRQSWIVDIYSKLVYSPNWGNRGSISGGAWNFFLRHPLQTGSGSHSASYPMGTGSSFPGGKAAGSWSWPFTSI